MTSIVIVESPTKAKTIKDFLPKDFKVMASMGHVRDLPQSASDIPEKYKKEPWAQLGVNFLKDFEPLYIVPKDKKKVVKELKAELQKADVVYLASDEDREGESISWHLVEVLKPKIPIKRMVFHEITKEAIAKALENCREINESLVRAQETRRILDRLVGYTLSPLLWKKVATGLSAGRVQSVSVRLLVLKERERRIFKRANYWDLGASLRKDKIDFEAKLVGLDGQKIAKGQDFDDQTGKLKEGKKVLLLDEKEARVLENRLYDKSWKVVETEERPSVKKPPPPFITSSMQQEASRKLRLSPRRCMQVAQGLYERGFITYMRTDSIHLSDQAVKAARSCVSQMYGKDYLTDSPREYKTKVKGAQEAHEAIRPAGGSFILPAKSGLQGMDLSLYDLIWKRTVATQMNDAKQTHTKVVIQVEDAQFQASGKRIDFPGFLRAYVEGSDDPMAQLEDKEVHLPLLKKGDETHCLDLQAKSHETNPPARYTEASLIKKLETEGIGRPSTYATIIDTIVSRGYVKVQSNQLIPSYVAFAVTNLLESHFNNLVDPQFTAQMEGVLDEIAANKTEWLPYIQNFFLGSDGIQKKTEDKTQQIPPGEYRSVKFEDLTAKVCIGRYGPFIEKIGDDEQTVTASIPEEVTPADLDQEMVDLIFLQQSKGNEEIGIHPDTEEPVYLLTGAYGPYIQLGKVEEGKPKPKRVTLPKGIKDNEVDLKTALILLSLPRELGTHPDTQGKIVAGISRYGSYILHEDPTAGKDFRSLGKEDSVLDVSLERALEILSKEKRTRRSASEPLREIGKHPEDSSAINVYQGPYGPYVKHKSVNASIPKSVDPQKLSLEEALELLEAKAKSKKKPRAAAKRKKK